MTTTRYHKRSNTSSLLLINYEAFCRAFTIICFLVLLVCNLLSYTSLYQQDDFIEHKNAIESESYYDVEEFLRTTLSHRLVEEFGNFPEISHLYNGAHPIILNSTTPQGKAFEWILNVDEYYEDSMKNRGKIDKSDNPTIVQRYVLAVLFFATEGEYNKDVGTKFTPQSNTVGHWTNYGTLGFLSPNIHECSWKEKNIHGSLKGVTACDEDTKEITELLLPELGLHGELPEEIGFLSNLVNLDLQNNQLCGSIPRSIAKLTKLKSLDLGHNKFVGRLPNNMGAMFDLQSIHLNYNNMDRDSIPSTLCELQSTGKLFNVWADCNRALHSVACDCCTVCCDPLSQCIPRYEQDDDIGSVDHFTK